MSLIIVDEISEIDQIDLPMVHGIEYSSNATQFDLLHCLAAVVVIQSAHEREQA